MSGSKILAGLAGSMLLMLASASATAGVFGPPNKPSPKPTDVPAPPVALIFGLGAAGLVWGRRLGSRRDK